MSSTNKTSNLELSQFIGTDSPKWLTDYNSDMQKIDAGVAAVQTQANATDLVVSGHTSSIQANTQSIGDQQTAITALRADVTAAQGSINTINSLIGNGEPTTTDKTIIGAINELAAEIEPSGGVSAASVSYNNTTSGLTASNVQAAIDEVDAKVDTIPTSASGISYNNTTSGLSSTTVQGAIDELATSTSVFTLAGTATGTTAVNIPSNATEIMCKVDLNDNATGGTLSVTMSILKLMGTKQYIDGYMNSASNYASVILDYDATANTVAINSVTFNGNVVTASATITVYSK